MKFVMDKPQYLKDGIKVISPLVLEARVKFSKEGIRIISSDLANVCMVIFKLVNTSFSKVECEEEVEIGLSLVILKDVLKKCGEKDILVFEDTKDGRFQLKIIGNSIKTFKIPIIDIDRESFDEPSINFDCSVIMKSSDLDDAIEVAGTFSESFSLIVDKKLTFKTDNKGTETTSEISKDIKIEMSKEQVKSSYSVEYMNKLVAGSIISDRVKIQLGDNFPIKLEYMAQDKIQLYFILAPRVENE